MLPQILITLSAAIILALTTLHLIYTFWGKRFWPRDAALKPVLEKATLHITTETTFWKTWIGFNASHSLGGMLFGLIYGYLGLVEPYFLFNSYFLLAVGFTALVAYFILGKVYWFSIPFYGITVSLICFTGGLISVLVLGDP